MARIFVTMIFLIYASWGDYKCREVSNRVWVYYAPIALILSIAEFSIYNPSILPLFGLSFGLTAGFSLLLFYSGGFGGADSKALMCIGLALPFFPSFVVSPFLIGGISPLSKIIFPITILSNSVLIAAASGLFLLIRNVLLCIRSKRPLFEHSLSNQSFWKKFLVLITGHKVDIDTLKAKWHVYPMEDVERSDESASINRKLVVIPHDEGRTEIVSRLEDAIEEGKIDPKVWATPGLPMLIFITVGLVLALALGDIVWFIIGGILN